MMLHVAVSAYIAYKRAGVYMGCGHACLLFWVYMLGAVQCALQVTYSMLRLGCKHACLLFRVYVSGAVQCAIRVT